METPTAYIIDVFNKYSRDKVASIFQLNGHWYCIKEVELDNSGKPILSSIEESEDDSLHFHVYHSLDEALEYVKNQRRIERSNEYFNSF